MLMRHFQESKSLMRIGPIRSQSLVLKSKGKQRKLARHAPSFATAGIVTNLDAPGASRASRAPRNLVSAHCCRPSTVYCLIRLIVMVPPLTI